MLELLTLLATASNFASFLTGIAASHIANQIPRKNDFDGHAACCFEQAAERWRVVDEVHASLFPKVSTIEKWVGFISSTSEEMMWVSAELTELWIEELHKDPVCAQKAVELQLDSLGDKIQSVVKKIESIDTHLKRIEDYLHRFSTRGRMDFKAKPRYIKRYCAPSDTDSSFLYYAGIDNDKTLLDYLLIKEEHSKKAPKIMLYGGMQTGKSTELEQLGYNLKQSGRYLPILIRLKNIPSLTKDELPDRLTVEGLPIVLLIDAVDETSERQFCTLMHDICDYAIHFSSMPIVVSCRSNFRKDYLADGFIPLDLLPLRAKEASNYVNSELGNNTAAFFSQINKFKLQSLATIPMTLNVLTATFKQQGKLPSTRTEIYDIIFHELLHEEKKKGVTDNLITEDEEQQYLERLAAIMLLRGSRSLSETELKQTFVTAQETKFDHLRYGILEKDESDRFFFVSNAMQELMASYFIFRCKTVDDIKKLVCLEGTEQVSPSWFNAMLLFLEQLVDKKPMLVQEVAKWLRVSGVNLLIHDEARQIVDETERAHHIIDILEKCKQANHHFIAFGDELHAQPRDLPLELVKYLLNEWLNVTKTSNHVRNLQLLTSMIDWDLLEARDSQLARKLTDQLYLNLNNPIFTGDDSYSAYAALSTEHFQTDSYTNRLFNVVKARISICDYTIMVSRIGQLADTSSYIDYLDKAEKALVPDRTTYHSYEREPLYKAIRKVTTREAVLTALKISSRDTFWRHANKKVIAQQTVKDLLDKAEDYLIQYSDNELLKAKSEAEKRQGEYIYQIPKPTLEQQQKSLNRLNNEICQFCNFIYFRGQARAYLTDPLGDGTHAPLDIATIYGKRRKSYTFTDEPNQFVVNFLIHYASMMDGHGNMIINEQKARAALNEENLYRYYRMRELYRYIRGEVNGVVITEAQKNLCYKTAQEILNGMVEITIYSGAPQDASLVLSCLIDGHIEVKGGLDQLKALLYYVTVPIENHTVNSLYDELADKSIILYVQQLAGEQQLQSMLFDLLSRYLSTPSLRIDSRIVSMWAEYLITAHHQDTVKILLDKVNHLSDMWDVWLSYLVKERSKIDILKVMAEKDYTGYLLAELSSLLMSDPLQHQWVRRQLEQYYYDYSCPQMGNRLRMLYRLGSLDALRLTLSNYHVLNRYLNNEFVYNDIDSVPLLCRMYNLCSRMVYSMTAQQTILTSLRNIAMQDRNGLEEVKGTVPRLIKSFGPNAFTPQEWCNRLEDEFRLEKSQNKDIPSLLSFLQTISS